MIKAILRSVLYPSSAPGVPSVLRRLVRGPRLFNLISTILQLRDSKRQRKILVEYASDDSYFQSVQRHNANVTLKKRITRTRRMEDFFRILDLPGRNLSKEQILHIGPRDINELFMAWVFGFNWDNIRGIDLYSTNPKISVMNMEAMTFPAERFDAVIMASTIAYAKNTEKCLAEIVRVLKPGGRAAFGSTYVGSQGEFLGDKISGNEIIAILRRLPVEVYFYRSQEKINARGILQTSHSFGIVKIESGRVRHDPVDLLRLHAY